MERTRLAPPGCRRDHCAMAVVAGHELLEREEVLDALGGALSDALAGSGRLVLVAGESGVGKTAPVQAFVDAPVAGGPCTGARAIRSPRRRRSRRSSTLLPARSRACRAALAGPRHRLRGVRGAPRRAGRPPAVLVIEDAHWADEATLDVLRLLGRRSRRCRSLVVVTYRDEPAGRSIRCASRWATSPARRRRRASPSSRSRRTRCARSPPAAASTPRSSHAAPAATRST